ncbi:MAG: hypothetical protein L6V89_00005 [Oscillospiraceae bacterium]|nr:MAG: hypothetical protein L6V89_00005 [Oscillospiraceae bacterium]
MDNSYRITSIAKAGDGRFDIQMLPLNKRLPGILIELKGREKTALKAQLEDLLMLRCNRLTTVHTALICRR